MRKPFNYWTIKFCLLLLSFRLGGFEIRDGWYYVDGTKFFVKGIGYETHTRPGQVPWIYEFDSKIIEFDFQRIKAAGYNTIRTWGALSEEELNLVQASGLKMLFGIWIDPHGDYSDPAYINSSLEYVSNIVSYSKRYTCILAYIIMNEPLVEDVANGGPENLLSLWQSAIDIIKQLHPGIPVTISNTAVGDYIRSDLFQIGAYNLYIYNPVLISNSHGYAGFCEFIKQHRSKDMPLIITEYGLSVSPGSSADGYGYGGNSLEQQMEGNLYMYRNLIDGGAQGACVFQYHDGWWKGGDENTHNDNPEEWFGLIEFDTNPGSSEGTPRPVWDAYARYNQTIIYEPKNQQIYTQSIPVEIFSSEAVDRMVVYIDDNPIIDTRQLSDYYYHELTPNFSDSVKDIIMDFYFYDENGILIKDESIRSLLIQAPINLPALEMTVLPDNLNSSSQVNIILDITTNPIFEIENNQIDYTYFPHIGFSPGEARVTTLSDDIDKWRFTDFFSVDSNVRVATFGAGYSIRYGNFTKRIYAQQIIFRDNWADPIAAPETVSIDPVISGQKADNYILLSNYPNPFNSSTTISFYLPQSGDVSISVINLQGQRISELKKSSLNQGKYQYQWFPETLSSGIFFIRLQTANTTITRKILLLK